LILDGADLMRAALESLCLTFSCEAYGAPQIASAALVRVLEDWWALSDRPFETTSALCLTQRE